MEVVWGCVEIVPRCVDIDEMYGDGVQMCGKVDMVWRCDAWLDQP